MTMQAQNRQCSDALPVGVPLSREPVREEREAQPEHDERRESDASAVVGTDNAAQHRLDPADRLAKFISRPRDSSVAQLGFGFKVRA